MYFLFLAACSDSSIQVRNTAPEVVFVAPGDNSVAIAGQTITFTAEVSDSESPDDELALYWQRSDGITVNGTTAFANGFASLTLDGGLPVGSQAITLLVTDPGAESGEDTVHLDVRVNQPPTLIVSAPDENQIFPYGTPINVSGTVFDPDGAIADIDLEWTSDLDVADAPPAPNLSGIFAFSWTDVPPGDHHVKLTASDIYGAESSTEINFSVDFVDADDDGFTSDSDCDDADDSVFPGATEIIGDGVDQNCDSQEACRADSDEDEHAAIGSPPLLSRDLDCADAGEAGAAAPVDDCDDTASSVFPGASELPADGIDQDCDGREKCWTDADEDGYRLESAADAGVVSLDLDCDDSGEATATLPAGDCDDSDSRFHPGAAESDCTDPNDYNCDTVVAYSDDDHDGFAACEDCNDDNDHVFPGATEQVADGTDQNCDGDEACYADADADGHRPVTPIVTTSADLDCTDPGEAGLGTPPDDCADDDASIHPGATERVDNGLDENCDGDERCFVDNDSDGHRASGSATLLSADLDCADPGEGAASEPADDCNDTESSVHPGASELCNATDDDCSASTPDGADDPDVGISCDGTDGDTCEEGTLECTGGDLTCNDTTGTGPCGPEPRGSVTFTTPGTFSYIVPEGVTSISAVAIGAGGVCGQSSYGGGGGALAYRNNVAVTPGSTIVITVGAGGSWDQAATTVWNGTASTVLGMTAGGGVGGNTTGAGGVATGGDANFPGGACGYSSYCHSGGGGAAGYTEAGRNGANGSVVAGTYTAGAGGAAGNVGLSGGSGSSPATSHQGGSGGGTEVYGTGAGIRGANGTSISSMGQGGKYGGGAGCGGNGYGGTPSTGGGGAVRLVWPGTSRAFPATDLVD